MFFNRWTRRAISGALLVVAGALPASAGTPQWLSSAASTPIPLKLTENVDAVMLLGEEITTVEGDGEIRTLTRRAFKILRQAGARYATFSGDFHPETRITYLKGWSIPMSGSGQVVKEKDAVEVSSFSDALYDEYRRKVVTLPDVEPGTIVGFELEQKRRPRFLHDRWTAQAEIPVARRRYVLRLPAGWEFSAQWYNHPERNPVGSGGEWAWELSELPAVEPEPRMPGWRTVAAHMDLKFRPPKGARPIGQAFSSWRELSAWYAQLAEGKRDTTPEIKAEVARLTANAKRPRDKLRVLAEFAQKGVRYVAIEIGLGALQPHAASAVLTSRYGDCKDKVTLLSAMLREAGIESHYILVHATRGLVRPEMAGVWSFNHVIAGVRLTPELGMNDMPAVVHDPALGPLLLFDPTDTATPLGFLPSNLQAGYGLPAAAQGADLMELPLHPPTLNRRSRVAAFRLQADGSMAGEVVETYTGEEAFLLRSRFQRSALNDRAKLLEKALSAEFGSYQLVSANIANLEASEKELIVQYRLEIPNFGKVAGPLLLLRPRVLGDDSADLLEGEPESGKRRQYPVEFEASLMARDLIEITLPTGYELDELPDGIKRDYGIARYQSRYEVTGNLLRYEREYERKAILVGLERLPDLALLYRDIKADQRSHAVLKRIP